MDAALFSKTYDVRKLNEADVGQICDLCKKNSLYYQYCPPAVSAESIRADMLALPPGITIDRKYYVGYFREGRLAAVLDLIDGYPRRGTAFIGFFMTDVSIQNRGAGTAIITELTGCLKASGYKAVRLAWVKGNPQAEHFWLKNGFTAIKETSSTAAEHVILAERTL